MICPKCNNSLNEGTIFCPYCGTNLNQQSSQENLGPAEEVIASEQAQSSEKKAGNKKIFLIIGIIAVIAIGGVFIFKNFSSDSKSKSNDIESLTNSSTFKLNNKNNLYALFNEDGKQITEFEFERIGDFVNGSAEVEKQNEQYGIISSSGKMLVDYGICNYIYHEGPLYKCVDSEYNNNIMDSTGKVILKGKKVDLNGFIGEYQYAIVEDNENKKYIVYDYKGNALTSFPFSSDGSVDSPSANSEGNYVSVFYNNMNYIFDVSKSKLILSFADKQHFCINKVNENNPNEFTINSCSAWYSSVDEHVYKLVRNGDIVYTKTTEESGNLYFEGNNVIFSEDGKKYILDEKGNNAVRLVSVIYKDYKNYAIQENGSFNGINIYVDGKLKETMKCNNIESGYAQHGIYLLGSCNGFGNGDKIYIKYDGTRLNDKSYSLARAFDKNGYAVVSEDRQEYYLINLKGEKVSENSMEEIFTDVEARDFYYITNEDGTKSIFGGNGNKLVTAKSVKIVVSNAVAYAILGKDNSYTIYDLKKKKDIVTVSSKPVTYKDYFVVSNNSKKQYYSYTTGKMFHEE